MHETDRRQQNVMQLLPSKRDMIAQRSTQHFLNGPQNAGDQTQDRQGGRTDTQLTFPPGVSEGHRVCGCVFRFPPEVFQTPEVPPRCSLTGSKAGSSRSWAEPNETEAGLERRSRGNAEGGARALSRRIRVEVGPEALHMRSRLPVFLSLASLKGTLLYALHLFSLKVN